MGVIKNDLLNVSVTDGDTDTVPGRVADCSLLIETVGVIVVVILCVGEIKNDLLFVFLRDDDTVVDIH